MRWLQAGHAGLLALLALLVPQAAGFRIPSGGFKQLCRTTRQLARDSRGRGVHLSAADSSSAVAGDVVVVGGGLAGLSVALELSKRGARVVVLNRDQGEAASLAAGGMLAPQAERLESGPYLDLCLQSRHMYADWVAWLEETAGCGRSTGFSAAGGFLAPAFAGDAVQRWQPPAEAGAAYYLDGAQMRAMEPLISEEVQGGWWFPEDMQVDARLLHATLKDACVQSRVTFLEGQDSAVEAVVFDPVRPVVRSLRLRDGRRVEASKVVVANGAWMNKLLPVPMSPIKGQMLSLRPTRRPSGPSEALLSRVLFSDDCYIIPKLDGRIVVGATVEPEAGFDRRVTAKGVMELTSKALRLCPGLAELEVEETWAGLRPTTPDMMPVLGNTPWDNLFVAGGYWRNGVLLAPRTGQLIADVVEGKPGSDLLEHFSWTRFLPGGKAAAPRRSAPPPPRQAPVPSTRQSQPTITSPAPSEAPSSSSSERMSIQEFAASLGYDASAPPAPTQEFIAKVMASKPQDTYGEYYVGDQTLKPAHSAMKQQQQEQEQQQAPKGEGEGEAGSFDPYADYQKLRQSVEREEVLREARRINREGSVGYGLEKDPLGEQVAARFSVPSAGRSGEWDRFEEAAREGLDMDLVAKLTRPVKSGGGMEEGGQGGAGAGGPTSLEDFVNSLGYEYEDPRLVKKEQTEMRRAMAQGGPAPAAGPAAATAPQVKQQAAVAAKEEEAKGQGQEEPFRPPWAHEIEAVYEKVRANQAAARRRRGASEEEADAPPVIPFTNTGLTEEDVMKLSSEERLGVLELFRANPDGSLERLERGQGLLPPWEEGKGHEGEQPAFQVWPPQKGRRSS